MRSLVARLCVGTVDKRVEIRGERSFSREGALREAARFSRMPLRYERAAGGPGTANPVGVRTGLAAQSDASGAVTLPNLQPVGVAPARRGDGVEPIGFGPLPASFPLRRERLGRYANEAVSLAEAPLPEDFDFAYFNVAPGDQQAAALKEDERIVLQNLHREHATLRTALPGARPRAFVERDGAPAREVSLRCDALWIDTDRAICAVVWRGEIPLVAPEERGRVVVALEERGARLRHEDLVEQAWGAPAILRDARERPATPVAPPLPPPVPPPPAPVRAPPSMFGSAPPVADGSSDDDDMEEAPITPNLPVEPPRAQPGGFAATARVPVFQPSAALPFLRDAPATLGDNPQHPQAAAAAGAGPGAGAEGASQDVDADQPLPGGDGHPGAVVAPGAAAGERSPRRGRRWRRPRRSWARPRGRSRCRRRRASAGPTPSRWSGTTAAPSGGSAQPSSIHAWRPGRGTATRSGSRPTSRSPSPAHRGPRPP